MAPRALLRGLGLPPLLWLLVGVLAAGAATTFSGPVLTGAGAGLGPVPLVVGIAVLFAVVEAVELEGQLRRQTFRFTLSGIPLVLALFALPPLGILLAQLVGGALAFTYRRRPVGRSVVNLAVMSAEVAAATVVFVLVAPTGPTEPLAWLAAFAAVAAADLVSGTSVLIALTVVEGRVAAADLPRILLPGAAATVISVTVALTALLVLEVDRWAVVLLAVLAVIVAIVYRAYARFLRQHKNLEELYEFTRAVGAARQDGGLADALLTRTRQLLSAESATLWLPAHGRHPDLLLTARADAPGVVDEPAGGGDPARRRAVDTGSTVLVGLRGRDDDPALRAASRVRGAGEVIVVPLRSATAVVGCLEVVNRLGEASFEPGDVRLLETLAAHAAVAVENSRLVDRLRHDAYHDALTGLPNRRRLESALDEAVALLPPPGEVVAVLQFDVDSLRDVNDTLGHVAGDRLLVEVGRRLTTMAPDGALIARLGGDEFAVLVRTRGAEGANALAVSLQYALAAPFPLDSFTLDVGAAVGIAVYPDHARDGASLLQRADVATYAAKSNPRSVQSYAPAMESRSVHRLGLVSELRRSIDSGGLAVHFQPMVALADSELLGVECLVRWEHPEHGLVSPDDFIPVAEHTGLIGALTTRVLRAALEQARDWDDRGLGLEVSVNLSARSLYDPDFPAEVERLLAEAGVLPQRLTLELTESSMVGDVDRPLPALHRLHDLGVRLSVDDFGTGYSSLSYLRRLPVDEVKIDKSFVLGMATDSGDLAIVRAIVDLSRHLGLTVVAEGVETERTRTLLEEMSCDVAQGFLFARPLPRERIDAWMSTRTVPGPRVAGDSPSRLRVVGD